MLEFQQRLRLVVERLHGYYPSAPAYHVKERIHTDVQNEVDDKDQHKRMHKCRRLLRPPRLPHLACNESRGSN